MMFGDFERLEKGDKNNLNDALSMMLPLATAGASVLGDYVPEEFIERAIPLLPYVSNESLFRTYRELQGFGQRKRWAAFEKALAAEWDSRHGETV